MTLEGTNTWIVSAPSGSLVIDPGPLLQSHLDAITAQTDERVAAILLTHGHLDHSEGAERFAEMVAAPVFAALSEYTSDSVEPLIDGYVIADGDISLRVVKTPGHTSDSLSFYGRNANESVLMTGDTILGRGSSIIAYPDGSVRDYLASLRDLISLLERDSGDVALLPGHGPFHAHALPVVEHYLQHRLERVDQVREAMSRGLTDVEEITRFVYTDITENLFWAAALSVQAQVAYLNETL